MGKRSTSSAKPAGELLPKKSRERTKPKPLSRVQKRGIEASTAIALDLPDQIGYQHTVLCQTSMPYRDPGKAVQEWEREQGAVSLRLEAGHAQHPETKEWVPLGLPFGPKSRLLLAHLNAEALKTGSPVVKIEESLTAFVRRIQDPTRRRKEGPNGYEIRAFKDHLARLSAAVIRMAVSTEERFIQTNSQIVDAFDLWFPKNKKQRVLWPSTIHLNGKYFASLKKHAVPLDERALAALSHSAMALDIYAWLAQRLHRVPRGRPQFITWAALKDQFGLGHARMNNFKAVFWIALSQVACEYPAAKIEQDGRGLTLRNSPPPVSKCMVLLEG